MLHRVFELKEEIVISLSGINNDDKNLYYNEDFIQKFVYLIDIFGRTK